MNMNQSQSMLEGSYFPVSSQSIFYRVLPVKKHLISDIERKVKIHDLMADLDMTGGSRKLIQDISLCKPCLDSFKASVNKLYRDKQQEMHDHKEFYSQMEVSRSSMPQNRDSNICAHQQKLHSLSSEENALQKEIAELEDRLLQVGEQVGEAGRLLAGLHGDAHRVSELEYDDHQLAEELDYLHECLDAVQCESLHLLPPIPSTPDGLFEKTLNSLSFLYDSITFDTKVGILHINNLRLAFSAIPSIQLNHREISHAYAILATYILHIQQMLNVPSVYGTIHGKGRYLIKMVPLVDRVLLHLHPSFSSLDSSNTSLGYNTSGCDGEVELLCLESGLVLPTQSSKNLSSSSLSSTKATVNLAQMLYTRSVLSLLCYLLSCILYSKQLTGIQMESANMSVEQLHAALPGLYDKLGKLMRTLQQRYDIPCRHVEMLLEVLLGLFMNLPIGYEEKDYYLMSAQWSNDDEDDDAGYVLPQEDECSEELLEVAGDAVMAAAWNREEVDGVRERVQENVRKYGSVMGLYMHSNEHMSHFLQTTVMLATIIFG